MALFEQIRRLCMKSMKGKLLAILVSMAVVFSMVPIIGAYKASCTVTDGISDSRFLSWGSALALANDLTGTENTETLTKLKPSAPEASGTLIARMTAGKTNLTISWNSIQGAAGYDIFFTPCKHHDKNLDCKKVKTIKGNKICKWTESGLNKGTPYKAYVKAYVMENDKKSYVGTSPMIYIYTDNGTKIYTNAKSVSVNKSKLTLEKGRSSKIEASVTKMKKKKELMPESYAPTLRYMTSDSRIATVSSDGDISAKGKGSCDIYVYAHNGVSEQIKVTVK